jgi:hypothetical protein
MWKRLLFVFAALVLITGRTNAQDPKAVLDSVQKAMGDVKSLQYSGTGAYFFLGQNVAPGAPWPRFNLKSYTRIVDYETPAIRDEFVRTQTDPAARGGGISLAGEQRQRQAVSGTYAWSQTDQNPPAPALAAVNDQRGVGCEPVLSCRRESETFL